jgi:lipid II:glycine glycyltransferase (peptidoglycan interpeptide bridge formation enzyme)
VGRLIGRANLFAPPGDRDFVAAALAVLAREGIPFVKVGDTMWGLTWSTLPPGWPFPHTRLISRHTLALDLTLDLAALLKRQETAVRTSIRKAEREGVAVCEVTSREDLDAYCALAGETTSRVRSVTAYTDFPSAFFQAVWARMVPEGTARMYLARRGVEPLAGCIILCGVGFGLYFAGASTRDRTLTALQGPTAVLWHAIQDLKRRGLVRFDFGGCTPTDDPGDPRYGVYAFKKRWGGVLESFSTLEVVLGPRRHALQERLLSPLWDRLQPFYFRLATRRAPSPRR